MEITIVDLPDRQAAAVLHRGPYDQIGSAFERLGMWAKTHLGSVIGSPLALYLDDPEATPQDQLRSYAALPVAQEAVIEPAGDVERIPLAGGRCAVAVHAGSYTGLGQSWQEFMAAVAADGLDPDWSRPCFEVYANDPGTVPVEQLRTELHQPIAVTPTAPVPG